MTIIAAINTDQGTYIGSDTQYTMMDVKIYGKEKWAFLNNRWAVGYAGYTRGFNLIEKETERFDDITDPYQFVERLETMYAYNDWQTDGEEGPPSYGGQILLASPDNVYSIDGTLSVVQIPKYKFIAFGNGAQYAYGAEFALPNYPKENLFTAINASIQYSDYCGGYPWVYLMEKIDA